MKALDWDSRDTWLSNYGAGPIKARILCVVDGTVTMIRSTRPGGPLTHRFQIPESYMQSPRCGWRVGPDRHPERQ
jgi:hypothetical protein